jgi:hypothetical protein
MTCPVSSLVTAASRALSHERARGVELWQGAEVYELFQRQVEGAGQRGDGEERRGGDPAAFDLPEGLDGNAGCGGDLHHAAFSARLTQQRAKEFAAGTFLRAERWADHAVILIPV